MEENQIVSFEKCVDKEFGPEMVKKIRENPYINCGQTKGIFDFLFGNLYSEKSARLVKLNLEIDKNGKPENKNTEITMFKIKNLELRKKLNEIKSKLSKEESHMNFEIKNLCNCKKILNTSKEDRFNKQLNNFIQESLLNKAKNFSSKIEITTKELCSIAETSNLAEINDKKKANFEHFLLNLNESNKNTQITNKLDIKECAQLSYLCIEEDLNNLHETIKPNFLKNEIELLKYKINSFYSETCLDKCPTVQELINEQQIEFIKRKCENNRFQRGKETNKNQFLQAKNKIGEIISTSYQNMEFKFLFNQYIRSYLMMNKTQVNYNELRFCSDNFKNEIGFLKNTSILIQRNQNRIKDLDSIINHKQLQINNLFKDNYHYLLSKLPLKIADLKHKSHELKELIDLLNSDQLFFKNSQMLTGQSNQTLNLNSYFNLNQFSLNKINLKFNFQIDFNHQIDEFVIENKAMFDKLFKIIEIKENTFCLFDKLLSLYLQTKRELNFLNRSDHKNSKYFEIQEITNDLNKLIDKCIIDDKQNLEKYVTFINESINNIHDFTQKEFKEMKKIGIIWWNQPGANEIKFDDYTINGRNFNYYMDIINEKIANSKRNKFI